MLFSYLLITLFLETPIKDKTYELFNVVLECYCRTVYRIEMNTSNTQED